MRNWIDLVNESWLNTVKAWNVEVDLFQNPSRAEWAKLFHQFPSGLRGHILASGDLVVWDAMHATHSDISEHLGSIRCGYRYFYPDHILFNDLNMEINDEGEEDSQGNVPHYGWYVSDTYKSTVENASVVAFYGAEPNIIGRDDEAKPSQFPINAAWVQANCVIR